VAELPLRDYGVPDVSRGDVESRAAIQDWVTREMGSSYRGVPRPERYRVTVGKELTEALAWKAGVDAARGGHPVRHGHRHDTDRGSRG